MTAGITRLLEPVVRTFGRRILFVVSVALAVALIVTAVVVAILADRAAREESERRFAELAGGALRDMLLGEGRDLRDDLKRSMQGAIVNGAMAMASNPELASGADALAVAHNEFQMLMIGQSVAADFWDPLGAPGFAAVNREGRLIWNKVDGGDPAHIGTAWASHVVVERAIGGAMTTVLGASADPSLPPLLPRDAAGLFVITAVPWSDVVEEGRGALLIARLLPQDDIDGFADATGVEVELRAEGATMRSARIAKAELPAAKRGQRAVVGPETYWAREIEVTAVDGGPAIAHALLMRPITAEVRLVRRIWTGIVGVFVLALAAGTLLGRAFAAPLSLSVEKLVEGSEAFRQRRYAHRIQVATKDELATLAESLNSMAAQLEKGEFIERTMRISVPRKYLDYILQHRDELGLDGALRDVTVLFCDLGGFTHFAEGKDPAEVVKSINDYFDVCTRVIETHDGMVDKFIGDAVMAIWNAPVAVADHPAKALIAALELANATEYVIAGWKSPEKLRIRVGVHSGGAVAGHIGARAHQQPYSVVGDTVNLASRLEGASKIYGTRVLTTRATRDRAGDAVEARFVDRVRLKGRDEAVDLFEVLAEKGSPVPPRAPEAEYLAAWNLYAARKFAEASDAFSALMVKHSADGPVATMAARCLRYAKTAPEDFDGVFAMEGK